MPPRRTPKGGTRGTVYREVARLRLTDAESLLHHGRYGGAIYLAGYAIECHLKFAICERSGSLNLPASLEVHAWEVLVSAAGLAAELKSQRTMSLLYDALVEQWGPALRYRTRNYPPREASRLYAEMRTLYEYLQELVP